MQKQKKNSKKKKKMDEKAIKRLSKLTNKLEKIAKISFCKKMDENFKEKENWENGLLFAYLGFIFISTKIKSSVKKLFKVVLHLKIRNMIEISNY